MSRDPELDWSCYRVACWYDIPLKPPEGEVVWKVLAFPESMKGLGPNWNIYKLTLKKKIDHSLISTITKFQRVEIKVDWEVIFFTSKCMKSKESVPKNCYFGDALFKSHTFSVIFSI